MDEFKKHIQQRLSEMDVDEPADRVWQQIKPTIPTKKRLIIQLPVYWAVAACVVLLAGIGLFILRDKTEAVASNQPAKKIEKIETPIKTMANDSPTIAKAIVPIKEKEDLVVTSRPVLSRNSKIKSIKHVPQGNSNESIANLASIESSFSQVINMQKERVNSTPLNAESPAYFTDFNHQIKDMEGDEASIKREIKKHGITNQLLNQLINIYQQKLNVLKQLQNEIQKTNNRYKQGRTPSDTTKRYFLNI